MKRSPKAGLNPKRTDEATAALVPNKSTIKGLRQQADACKACDLWKTATQMVFGEGNPRATIMLVGEQPGDREDRVGKPFVGPAGKLLDEALSEAGIDRSQVYVTNVVKHFKWTPSEHGKRRIHKKPRYFEIQASRPWLAAELSVVRPRILVCLGATAAQSLLGREFSVTRQRGELVESELAPFTIATVHPSSILRAPDAQSRRQQMRAFVDDLKQVVALATKTRAK
jgi:uracil-DNA glycosylase family protein